MGSNPIGRAKTKNGQRKCPFLFFGVVALLLIQMNAAAAHAFTEGKVRISMMRTAKAEHLIIFDHTEVWLRRRFTAVCAGAHIAVHFPIRHAILRAGIKDHF
ncbi:hypothetical protein FJY93_03565 [Candidatus Kaiserbacteria bacterium]|nr:hypothetical protein [Candidatus Kaiserbacteria bacterium]